MEELDFHVHDRFVAEEGPSVKKGTNGRVKRLNNHLAENEVKSSRMMFKVESLDRMFLNASSLMWLIPNF